MHDTHDCCNRMTHVQRGSLIPEFRMLACGEIPKDTAVLFPNDASAMTQGVVQSFQYVPCDLVSFSLHIQLSRSLLSLASRTRRTKCSCASATTRQSPRGSFTYARAISCATATACERPHTLLLPTCVCRKTRCALRHRRACARSSDSASSAPTGACVSCSRATASRPHHSLSCLLAPAATRATRTKCVSTLALSATSSYAPLSFCRCCCCSPTSL